MHLGHYLMRSGDMTCQLNRMSEDEKRLACDCAQISFCTESVAELLNIRNVLGAGVKWDRRQIQYLKQSENQDLN